jgi:LmbE family N-acetylglucosaminyl deacetylase
MTLTSTVQRAVALQAPAREHARTIAERDLATFPELAKRVLVIAPHPDDDVLAASGVIQWAARQGGEVRVLYLTDGENNPWAQRLVERRWRIGRTERRRWGARRRREALQALARLHVLPRAVSFTGLPDQHLRDVLLQDAAALVRPLGDAIAALAPTLVLAPSRRDRHPDHGAVAIATRAALARTPEASRPLTLAYGIHGPFAHPRHETEWTLALDECSRGAKCGAALAHESQLAWHRRAFVAAASDRERFRDECELLERDTLGDGRGQLLATPRGWSLEMRLERGVRFEPRALVVSAQRGACLAGVRVPLSSSAKTARAELASAVAAGTLETEVRGSQLRARFVLREAAGPVDWFVKLERTWSQRLGFMDHQPWLAAHAPR